MEWQKINNKLEKEYVFSNFKEAIEFINRVGVLAEEMDHHPDICLHSYKKVNIRLFTHSKKEITELDHTLAQKIDQL